MRSWVDAAGAVDPDDARRAADDILARPEYREPQPSLVDRVLDAIGDVLGRAFDAVAGTGAGDLVGTVVIAALVVLAAWLLWRATGVGWRRSVPATTGGLVQGTSAPDDPARWRSEAEALARRGDHRGALRCRYQALVAGVLRSRLVEEVPGRTPAELRRELAGSWPDLDPALGSVTDRFERAWYGAERVDAAADAAFAADVADLESALTRRTVPT